MIDYQIETYTSDLFGAGTDAAITLVIYGENDEVTAEHPLVNKGHKDFERNQTDNFNVMARDVGKIKCIRLKSSNTGLGAAWHLGRITVYSSSTKESLEFPGSQIPGCGWFNSKQTLGFNRPLSVYASQTHPAMSMSLVHSYSEGFALVVLNRPSQLNSLNLEMVEVLSSLLSSWAIDAERRVSCILIRGAGDKVNSSACLC